MKKIYFATSNQHKLVRLQKIFTQIDPEIIIEIVPKYIDVPENGRDGFENSLFKIKPYLNKYQIPVLTADTAVFIEGENFNPTHVRRAALQDLDESSMTQAEIAQVMNDFYKHIADKYGGHKDFHYIDYWTMLSPDGTIKQTHYHREYILTNISHGPIDIYFPMRNLYLSKYTGTHTLNQTDQDFFLEFSPQINALKELISKTTL